MELETFNSRRQKSKFRWNAQWMVCGILVFSFVGISVCGRSEILSRAQGISIRSRVSPLVARFNPRKAGFGPSVAEISQNSLLAWKDGLGKANVRVWAEQGTSPDDVATNVEEKPVEDVPEDSTDPEKEAVEGEEEPQILPTQKLFAVIEMAESAGAIENTLEETPSLKEEQEAYLKDLMDKGLIISSGSFESQEALTGVWVIKADSLESALKIRDNSPFWTAGMIPNTIVRQWNAVGDFGSESINKQLDEARNELNELKEIRAAEAAKAEQYAAQVAKVQDAYTRVMNDFTAYKKRTDKEKELARTDGKGAALRKLMGMIDNFAFIFDAVDPQTPGEEDIDMAYRSLYDQMIDIFKTEGLEEFGNVGDRFDFDIHQAVESVYTEDHPDGIVLKVVKPGFKIDGKLIRPAFVEVSQNPNDPGTEGPPPAAENTAAPNENTST